MLHYPILKDENKNIYVYINSSLPVQFFPKKQDMSLQHRQATSSNYQQVTLHHQQPTYSRLSRLSKDTADDYAAATDTAIKAVEDFIELYGKDLVQATFDTDQT